MIPNVAEDVTIQKQLTDIHISDWLRNDVNQIKWWLLIGIILFSFVVWWILLDKSRILEISLYMALAMIMCMGIDEYGQELTLWNYPIDVIAVYPPLSSLNLIMIPEIFSLIYQRFSQLKSFIWAAAVSSAIITFLLEPLLSHAGFYELIHWHYYESTPIYFGIALVTRALIRKIYSTINKAAAYDQDIKL